MLEYIEKKKNVTFHQTISYKEKIQIIDNSFSWQTTYPLENRYKHKSNSKLVNHQSIGCNSNHCIWKYFSSNLVIVINFFISWPVKKSQFLLSKSIFRVDICV